MIVNDKGNSNTEDNMQGITAEARTYGYARVSSTEQNLDRQKDALIAYGVGVREIFEDKASGKDLNRPSYQLLRNQLLRRGDTLVIHELDRLSRNAMDIKRELMYYKDKGIRVKFLNLPTTLQEVPEEMALVHNMVNNIMIEVYAAQAQSEREHMLKRQKEGIASAHKRGVKFGRPIATTFEEFQPVYERVRAGELLVREATEELGIGWSTYYKYKKQFEGQLEGLSE